MKNLIFCFGFILFFLAANTLFIQNKTNNCENEIQKNVQEAVLNCKIECNEHLQKIVTKVNDLKNELNI